MTRIEYEIERRKEDYIEAEQEFKRCLHQLAEHVRGMDESELNTPAQIYLEGGILEEMAKEVSDAAKKLNREYEQRRFLELLKRDTDEY